jgi:hypothetical protein
MRSRRWSSGRLTEASPGRASSGSGGFSIRAAVRGLQGGMAT